MFMTLGASRWSSGLLQDKRFIGKGPPQPFIDLWVDRADGELHSCYPLSQVEQLLVALSQETEVFVDHVRGERLHSASHQRFGEIYRLAKPRLIPHRGHVAPDAVDEFRRDAHQIGRSVRNSRAQYPHFFLRRRRIEPGVETPRAQWRRQVMAYVVREQDDHRPTGGISDSDIAETWHVRHSASEQLQKHVLDLLGQLVGVVNDQYRGVVQPCEFEGRQGFAEDQVFTRELLVLSLSQLRSRRQFLPDHLRLRLPVPRIEDVRYCQIVHPLQVEARQIAGLGQTLRQRRLADASRPLDQQRLAAA